MNTNWGKLFLTEDPDSNIRYVMLDHIGRDPLSDDTHATDLQWMFMRKIVEKFKARGYGTDDVQDVIDQWGAEPSYLRITLTLRDDAQSESISSHFGMIAQEATAEMEALRQATQGKVKQAFIGEIQGILREVGVRDDKIEETSNKIWIAAENHLGKRK